MTTKQKADDRPVTMKDVAALNGIGAAPDASTITAMSVDEARAAGVFISAGMMSDIEAVGWTRSPGDGSVIASDATLKAARERETA